MREAVIHLASFRDGVAACGRWSKHITRTAANITCETCRATRDFAEAVRTAPGPKARQQSGRQLLGGKPWQHTTPRP
jgi:hypothetical protein